MNRILNLILMNLFLVIGLSLSAKDSFDAVSRIVSPLLTDSIKDYDPYFVESDVMISKFGPTSISRNMVQACDGSVWIACWQGIIQFDGEGLVNLKDLDGDLNAIYAEWKKLKEMEATEMSLVF